MSRVNVLLRLVVLMIIFSLIGRCVVFKPRSAILPSPKEVQITEEGGACGAGDGLNTGDTLVLILDGIPSTGYTWEIGFYVPQVIQPVGEPDFQPNSNQVGADGKYTFRFVAVGEGEVALRMIYRRPSDKDVPELKTCEVNVKVE